MRILLVTIFTFLATSLFAQNLDCQEYKNGKFKILNEKNGNTIITRNGEEQVEYSVRSKIKIKFNVNWVDNCKFTLKLDEVLENPNDIWFPEDATFTVEIIETKEDSYIQRTTSTFTEMVTETEAFKVE